MMKKEFKKRLFSWIFSLVLLFPLGVDFVHVLIKHHNVGYQAKLVDQVQKVKPSCAIFHRVLNYNTPIVSNTFVLNIPNIIETSFVFSPSELYNLNHYNFSLRAPPLC